MNIELQVEYESLEGDRDHYCFHHAVMRTFKGERFNMVVDDYGSFISHTSCVDCKREFEVEDD